MVYIQNKKTSEEIAKRLWRNCIHSNIGAFTLTQEKRAINNISTFIEQEFLEQYNHLSKQYKGIEQAYKELKDKSVLIEDLRLGSGYISIEDVEKMINKIKICESGVGLHVCEKNPEDCYFMVDIDELKQKLKLLGGKKRWNI